MITRIRLEAAAKTVGEVHDNIYDFIAEVRTSALPGQTAWQQEAPLEVQTTKDGYWGHYTIRRKHG